MGYHDIAQVCPNGHAVNDSTRRRPQHNKGFCPRCGEKTITACPGCNNPIEGDYHVEGVVVVGGTYSPPAFCHACGDPFPWTERKQQAAIELFLEEVQDKKEQEEFRQSVEQIAKDTPQSQVASK